MPSYIDPETGEVTYQAPPKPEELTKGETPRENMPREKLPGGKGPRGPEEPESEAPVTTVQPTVPAIETPLAKVVPSGGQLQTAMLKVAEVEPYLSREQMQGKAYQWLTTGRYPTPKLTPQQKQIVSQYAEEYGSVGKGIKEIQKEYEQIKTQQIKAQKKQEEEIAAAIATQEKAISILNEYKEKDSDNYFISRFLQDRGKDNVTSSATILKDAGFSNQQIAEAKVEAFYRPASIGAAEPGAKPPGIAQRLAFWQEGYLDSLKAVNSNPVIRYGEGLVAGIAGLITSIPVMAATILTKPTGVPEVAKGVWDGVVQTGKTWVIAAKTPKAADPYNIGIASVNTAAIAMMAKSGFKVAKGAVSRVVTYIEPRGVPVGGIGIEPSTGRLKVGNLNPKVMADALLETQKQAMTPGGPSTGTVPIPDTNFNFRYIKTPIQQQVGNILFHGSRDGLKFVEQSKGKLKAGQAGIYTDPWAAVAYARGENPGLVMVITDTSIIKPGGKGLARGITQSDTFVRGAKKGYYGPSKVWRGDLETEIVGAPGTANVVPKPTADLPTRLLAGRYSDFFTYDAGKFVPIKLVIDEGLIKKGIIPKVPGIIDLYATKLLTIKYTLRNMAEALKHPNLVLEDLVAPIKAVAKQPWELFESGAPKGGRIAFPGLRDVYLTHNWGAELKSIANKLFDKVVDKVAREAKTKNVKPGSIGFERIVTREMELAYIESVRSMLKGYAGLIAAYESRPEVRSKFETVYLANLSSAIESMTKSSIMSSDVITRVTSDIASRSEMRSRTPSEIITPRITERRLTDRRPREPISSISTIRTPRRLRRPSTPRIPSTPYTPEQPRRPSLILSTKDMTPAELRKAFARAYAWKQGFGWWAINEMNQAAFFKKPLPGWKIAKKGTPFETIQQIRGKPITEPVTHDLGIMDVVVKSPSSEPGKLGAIVFRRDIRQRTSSPIKLMRRRSKKKTRTPDRGILVAR